MPKDGKINRYIAIQSMFISGNVKRLKDIEKLYPTAIAKDLGMNHSRYIKKLYKPETLSGKQIMLFSNIIGIDSRIVWDIIAKQLSSVKISRKKP